SVRQMNNGWLKVRSVAMGGAILGLIGFATVARVSATEVVIPLRASRPSSVSLLSRQRLRLPCCCHRGCKTATVLSTRFGRLGEARPLAYRHRWLPRNVRLSLAPFLVGA